MAGGTRAPITNEFGYFCQKSIVRHDLSITAWTREIVKTTQDTALAHNASASCAAAEHPCVPASHVRALENAYHKEAQKLREAVGENKRLKALYEEALAEADHRNQDSVALYGRMQELEDQVSEYAIRLLELEAGNQEQKNAQGQPPWGAMECFGDQTHEEGEIVDMISATELVVSNIDDLACDIQACVTNKRKTSNSQDEEEQAEETRIWRTSPVRRGAPTRLE